MFQTKHVQDRLVYVIDVRPLIDGMQTNLIVVPN